MTPVEHDSSRPRLLYLCQQNPWRLAGGGLIRNYWIARALAQRFAVDLVTADDAHEAPEAYARHFHAIRGFARPRGPIARARRALSSVRPGASLLTAGTVTPALRAHLARATGSERYHGAIFDLNMLEALPPGVPRIYHAHNCETALLRRRSAIERGPARLAVALDAKRLAAIETRVLREARLVIACSDADVVDLASLDPTSRSRSIVVTNGVDIAGYATVRDERPAERSILITGSYDWRPNQLGLEWFCADVLPALRSIAGGRFFAVRVAGRMSAEYARKIARHPPIVAVPNPVEMKDELGRASVVVAPILASSGTRLRILEGWASSRPVVTTPQGAFGLAYTNDRDLIVRESADPHGFAAALWRVLDDSVEQAAVAKAGFERALGYDWPTLGGGLAAAVERAIARA